LDCQNQELITTSGRGAARRAAIFEIVENGDEDPMLVTGQGTFGIDCVELREFVEEEKFLVVVNGDEFAAMSPDNGFVNSILKNHIARVCARWHYKLGVKQQRAYLAKGIGKTMNTLLVKGNMGGLPSDLNDMVCIGSVALRRIARGGFVELAKATTQRKCLDEVKRLLVEHKKQQSLETEEKEWSAVAVQRSTYTQIVETDESPEFSVNAEEVMCMALAMQRCDVSSLASFVTALMRVLHEWMADLENSFSEPTVDLSANMQEVRFNDMFCPTIFCGGCVPVNEGEVSHL